MLFSLSLPNFCIAIAYFACPAFYGLSLLAAFLRSINLAEMLAFDECVFFKICHRFLQIKQYPAIPILMLPNRLIDKILPVKALVFAYDGYDILKILVSARYALEKHEMLCTKDIDAKKVLVLEIMHCILVFPHFLANLRSEDLPEKKVKADFAFFEHQRLVFIPQFFRDVDSPRRGFLKSPLFHCLNECVSRLFIFKKQVDVLGVILESIEHHCCPPECKAGEVSFDVLADELE